MTARDNVQTAKLKRIPADAFEAEARRRGYSSLRNRRSLAVVGGARYEANHLVRGEESEATHGALLRDALCGYHSSNDAAADALCQLADEIEVLDLAVYLDSQHDEGRLNPEIFRSVFEGIARRARVAAELASRMREEERNGGAP